MNELLNYPHPYVSVQIVDNTIITDEPEVEDTRREFNGCQVGFFSGGEDNKLLYFSNQTDYLRECGQPNYKKFGQAAYNVDNALATDACGMYVLNLRPDTATFANCIIMTRIRVVTDTPPVTGIAEPSAGGITPPGGGSATPPKKKLQYTFYAKYLDGATTEDQLLTYITGLIKDDPDADGWYDMPFMAIYSKGRGEYGNGIRFRFENNTNFDLEYTEDVNIRFTYRLSILEKNLNNSLAIREYNYGCLDPDAFDNTVDYGPSLFLEDTINDLQYGSQRIHADVCTETLDIIKKLYNEEVNTENTIDHCGTLDILFGKNLDGTENPNLELDTTQSDYINLFGLDGIELQGGTDGFDGMNPQEVEDEKNRLLIKAYSGEVDPMIKSRFASPCDFNLDANYNIDVKREMVALAKKRPYDFMTYLDTNLLSRPTSCISFLTSKKNLWAENVENDCGWFKWRDTKYTGKVCNMTITHWLAKAIPLHMTNPELGLSQSFARENAVLQSNVDFIHNSFMPVIHPDNDDIKKQFYILRTNCYQTSGFNRVKRSTAITTYPERSDRLLEINQYVIQYATRLAYDILESKIYHIAEEDDRNRFEEDANDIMSHKLLGFVQSVKVEFEMTARDKKTSLLRLKLSLVMNTVTQQGEVIVYINPRVTDTEEAVAQ